jgi:uncharacterized protein (UPF0548 family)
VGEAVAFERVVDALLSWRIHRRAGFRIIAAPERVEVGAEFVARAPRLPVTTRCEVIEVIEEPGRAGFRYRTLPRHPLEGEELFLVSVEDGRTVFSVSESSRPAMLIARLPGARAVQGWINRRYLEAAADFAAR